MASQSAAEPLDMLTAIVRGWDRQWRMRRFVAALPRAILPGVLTGVVLAVIARIGPYIPELTIALIAAGVALLGALIAALWVFGRGRSLMLAARRFDRMLEMQERVSTALELIDGRIQASALMAELQIRDALECASEAFSPQTGRQRAAAAPEAMRQETRISRRTVIALLLLFLTLIVLLLLFNPNSSKAADDARTASSIESAGQTLRQIAADTMTDPNLEVEDRQAVLQAIQESLLALAQPDVSREEALAAVSDAQETLQSLADRMTQDQRSSQQAAAEAAQSLRSLGEEPRIDDPFAELGEQLAQLAAPPGSPASETADPAVLEQVASALQNSPDEAMQQAADNLRQAAADAREGNTDAAQEQIQQAAEQLREAQQQNEQRQQAAESASQQAEQAQQAAEQLRDQQDPQARQGEQNAQDSAGGESPQSQDQSMFDQQGQQDSQGGQGQQLLDSPQGGQQSQNGEQGASGTGQQSSGDSSESQSGDGSASGGQGQPLQPQDSQQSTDGAQQAEGSGGASSPSTQSLSAGAGDQPGDNNQPVQGNPLTDASNNPDGSGQRDYEAVYAPQRIGGPLGASEIYLQAEDQSAPSVEGEYARNPEGSSTVPYNRVFSNYANAVSSALDNGYIPLGLRDVVRQYFSALEPAN